MIPACPFSWLSRAGGRDEPGQQWALLKHRLTPAFTDQAARSSRSAKACSNSTHQLEATRKALRLSDMLETFEAHLTQARAGYVGHVEFLQALCEVHAGGVTWPRRPSPPRIRTRAPRFNA